MCGSSASDGYGREGSSCAIAIFVFGVQFLVNATCVRVQTGFACTVVEKPRLRKRGAPETKDGILSRGRGSSVIRQLHKVLQELQSDGLAFLRMKLCRKNVVAPDGGSERFTVFRARCNDGIIRRLG